MTTRQPTPLLPFYRDGVQYAFECHAYFVSADGLDVFQVQALTHPALPKGRYAAQKADRVMVADNCAFGPGERLFLSAFDAYQEAASLVAARVVSLSQIIDPLEAKRAVANERLTFYLEQLGAPVIKSRAS